MASGISPLRIFGRFLSGALTLALGSLLAPIVVHAEAPAPGQTAPARLIRAGVFNDNNPFSHIGPSGAIEGFAVDLLAAVERTMSLRIERETGPTDKITAAFNSHRLDLLQSFAQTPARETLVDFSVPYLTMAGSIFVRKGESGIRSFEDLRGRRVMVHRGSFGEQLLRAAGLENSIVYVESVEQALRKLDAGENDATLVSRLTGLTAAHTLRLKHIEPAGDPVPGYNVRYCFAVHKGDRQLLARLNEGLAILQRTGEFERIYRKWFGHVDPAPGYSALQVSLAIAAGLAVALAIALYAALRQRTLHQHLARQAIALRASEERYRGLFGASQEGLLVLAPSLGHPPAFIVEEANSAARKLLPFTRELLAGARLDSLFSEGPQLSELLAANLIPGNDSAFEFSPEPARFLRVSASRIAGRVFVVISDLTEARRAAEQIRLREQQLRQTQKLEALGTLAGGVAHDFNNVLTSILGNADIAGLDLPPGSSVHTQLDEIRTASERARHLVRQILTYTRHAEPHREALHLTPLIEECLRFLRATVRRSIEIRHKPLDRAPEIEGDATQIHQVLMNLCTNAVHAIGDAAGSLEVVEELVAVTPEIVAQHPQLRAGRFLRIAIRDTGCGMPPEIIRRMFEPFFTTKSPGQGTGLGLSVVHGIIQNHQGAITVYSKPGEGTLFHLYFPVSENAAVITAAPPVAGIPRGQGERILFLDDELPIARAASQLLQRLGYAVSAHHEAPAALAVLAKDPAAFSLLITDLTMPRMTGLEVIQQAIALRPDLRVILISGFMSEADLARARELGVTRVLDKPLTLSALGRTVAEALRS